MFTNSVYFVYDANAENTDKCMRLNSCFLSDVMLMASRKGNVSITFFRELQGLEVPQHRQR